MTSPPRPCREIKKAKAFLHATKHCRTVSTFSFSTLELIKFRQPMAKKLSDYCSLLTDACPMPTTPSSQKHLLRVFNGVLSTIVLLPSGIGGVIYNVI